jgi:DMSO/TMAO reductase YedYZ molybdopterin-dependent catalytic subunit
MESAMHPQTLIAYGMDGRWLGARHGAPARLHSPIKLGYKSTKYLVRVTFMPERNGGYWSDRGYEWFAGT